MADTYGIRSKNKPLYDYSKLGNGLLEAGMTANGFMPITGDIQSGLLAANDLKQGNYGSAALNGLGILPFVPSLGGVAGGMVGMTRPKYLTNLVDVLNSGKAADVNFGSVSARNEKRVNAFRDALGQDLIKKGDSWVIPENVVKKIMDKRIGVEGKSAESIADSINSAVHNSKNKAFQTEHPHIQGLITPKENVSNVAFVGVNPKTSDPVIKTGHNIRTERIDGLLGDGNQLLEGHASSIANTAEAASHRSAIPEQITGLTNIADNNKNAIPDYGIQHRPPMKDNGGAPLHDLTGGGEVYPDDIYSKQAVQYYGTGDRGLDAYTMAKINYYKDKPDLPITMYRAVGKEVPENAVINNGDWVTINPDYAKQHGESALYGDYRILKEQVPARKLFTNGDSIHEFGYDQSGKIDPRLLGLMSGGGLLGLGAYNYGQNK